MTKHARENASRTATASPSAVQSEPRPARHEPTRTGTERYEMRGEHGRGGIGRVSRALDHSLGREVAIKQLIAGGIVPEVRFLREARITARLEHPGIVPVYEAGRWSDGSPYYAMKLVAGRPLRALIVERDTVAERIALLHHVIAVADAMAYAHDRGVIHRDLKPGNVIAGDFGETIVIDWGLAKELGTADELGSRDGAPTPSGELTGTGGVIGTPAYMAPEQARGELVDQRADVYAIGMMLWELCSLERAPEPAERPRVLRRNGIDPDLITILDKALQDDPAQRYRDAGALAADLKAFKAGARIAARSYSLPALLRHWARRHRALTTAIVGGLAAVIAVTVLYLRGLAEAQARQALEHAELLLQTDPSAASELLATYRGRDVARARRLAAEAVGVGVATLRAQPHTQSVYFATALPDGTIASISADGAIAKTAADGATRVIGRGVAPQYTYGYLRRRHVVVYACNTAALCMFDLANERALPPLPDLPSIAPTCVDVSPSQHQIAAITPRGEVVVWRLDDAGAATRVFATKREGGEQIHFVDERTLIVETPARTEVVHMPSGAEAREGVSLWGTGHTATNEALHLLTVANAQAELVTVDTETHATTRSAPVCKGYVNLLLMLHRRAQVAFACQDGDAGIYDLATQRATTITHLEGGAANIEVSADDRYVIIGGTNGHVAIYDATTERVTTRLGHSERIQGIEAPTAAYPYLITGDLSGALRVWPMPGDELRVASRTASRLGIALPLGNAGPTVAVSLDPEIPWRARDGRTGALTGHVAAHNLAARSATRAELALFGTDEGIEWYSLEPGGAPRTLASAHGAITAGGFAGDGALVTGARGGAIERWGRDGATAAIGDIAESVGFVRAIPTTNDALIGGVSGALWRTRGAALERIAGEPQPITSASISGDGRWLAIGDARGQVRICDLAAQTWRNLVALPSAIEHVELSPDGAQLLVVARSRLAIYAARDAQPVGEPLPAVRTAAFSADGRWLAAVGTHGGLWFHRRADDHWVYVATGLAKLTRCAFADDSAQLVATDAGGRALVVDLQTPAFR